MRSTRAVLMTGLLAAALCSIALSAQVGHQAEPQIAGFQAPDTASPAVFGGDSIPDLIVSPASGTGATHVFSGAGFGLLGAGFPFNPNFAGGVRVAAGDINGDGVADVVAGQGPGGSLVTLINGATITSMGSGHPFGAGFPGGVYVASADVNGDGLADIVVGQGTGGGRLMVFSGADISLLMNVTPFGPSFTGGVTVAAGDVNGDGFADVFAGQASAGGAVALIDGATRGLIAAAPVFGPSGVSVALGDVNGDGRADAIMAPHLANGPVIVYDVLTVTPLASFVPYGASNRGVRLASADFDGDGLAEIVTGPGPGGGSTIRVISGGTFAHLVSFDAFGAGFNGGVYVAAPSLRRSATFTSPASTTFAVGQAGTFTVTTSGVPSVTSITRSGTLPAGVSFVDNGNGTATLSGTPTSTGGAFALTLTASNGVGAPATQNFVLTVNQAPAITSAASANFAEGTPNTFTVTATGFPVPTLQRTGSLPGGLTFVDNGNGTATLSGTAADGSAGPYPLTVTASNGVNPAATQSFNLTVEPDCTAVTLNPAPGALVAGAAGVVYGPVNITAAPSATYTFTVTTGTLPAGLTLSAAGVLAGTPTATGNFSFTVSAATSAGCSGTAAYTLSVAANAQDDSFLGAVGNTEFVVGAGVPGTPHVLVGGNVLANDAGAGALTVTAGTIATTGAGQVMMAANGTFTYTPAVGFVGSDTFTYAMTDANGATDTATVTIPVGTPVWYVNAAAAAGDGRSHNPFNTMTAAAATSAAGSAIYVHPGAPAGDTVLKASQTLAGSGAAFAFGNLTIPASTSPTLAGTITLADNVLMSGITVNAGASDAIVATNVNGAVTLSQVAVTGGATGVSVNGGTATMNIGATIAGTTVRSVSVQNKSGGVVTFSGGITDTAQGILLNANPSTTIAFTGGMTLNTGTWDAFTATGGGTVTATQNNTTILNTIQTTSGVALRVQNTNIGAAGLTFRTVSVDGSNTPGAGIILDNTGTSAEFGSLTVTGAGTLGSGGQIHRKDIDTGADPWEGVGIYLNNTKAPAFHWMDMFAFDRAAFVVKNSTGFTLANSIVSLAGGSGGAPIVFGSSATAENGLLPGGIALLQDTDINEGVQHNVVFFSQGELDPQALPTTLRVIGTSAAPDPGDWECASTAAQSGHGIFVDARGTAAVTVEVDRCRVRGSAQAGLMVDAIGTAAVTVTVNDAAFVGSTDAIWLRNAVDADITATITNSGISGYTGRAVRFGQGGGARNPSRLNVTITGNSIGSEFSSAAAIEGTFSSELGHDLASARVLISDNGAAVQGDTRSFSTYGPHPGILMTTASGAPRVDLTILNNHIDLHDQGAPAGQPGLRANFGIDLQATTGTMCAAVGGAAGAANLSHWMPTDLSTLTSLSTNAPGTAGTTLALGVGEGLKMPTHGAFYAWTWPAGEEPTAANTEVVLVTAVVGDTLTIVRAQEGTPARNIAANDNVRALGGRIRAMQAGGTFQLDPGPSAGANATQVLNDNNTLHPVGPSQSVGVGTFTPVAPGACNLPTEP